MQRHVARICRSAVAPEFIERLRVKTEEVIVGDPRKSTVFVGPLVDHIALAKFKDAVEDGQQDGGTLIAGGTVLRDGACTEGVPRTSHHNDRASPKPPSFPG